MSTSAKPKPKGIVDLPTHAGITPTPIEEQVMPDRINPENSWEAAMKMVTPQSGLQ
jgi:hypothetical protein